MIQIATIEQVRVIEAEADAAGHSYDEMMDRAGRAVADRAVAMLDGIDAPRVTVLIGGGNNGGDGLVAGLYLAQDMPNADVRFYLLTDRDDTFITTAQEAGLFIAKASDDHDKRVLRNMVASADLVLDALFGIGVRLPISGEAQQILRHAGQEIRMRRQQHISPTSSIALTGNDPHPRAPQIRVLAVDCPSGMNCDTGASDQWMIAADETVTFITAKPGLFLYPAAAGVGQLFVAPIGIPNTVEALKALDTLVIDANLVRDLLPDRTSNSHKGTYGQALIVGGSINYIGAPALSAEAAYRVGAGLVSVAAPANVITAVAGTLREVTWLMLPHDMGVIATDANAIILKNLERVQAMLIGPGMGTEKTTRNFLNALLNASRDGQHSGKKRSIGFGKVIDNTKDNTSKTIPLPPLVIDADGLNLLTEIPDWHTLLPDDTIITPHPGEMARLCNLETGDVQANRWQLAREKAQEWGVVVVLKGAYTVIAHSTSKLAVLPFAIDALATAGTGDILAGLIVGLRAQGLSAWDAACVGTFIHAKSGQALGKRTSSRSIIAGDLFWQIGEVFQELDD
ncbi:MAG: bifunctional ADP-dependent NAD(P)H-hydrate dehydratase/NAD(P)H-hydrate epimerase [Anaerolineae bacterium]